MRKTYDRSRNVPYERQNKTGNFSFPSSPFGNSIPELAAAPDPRAQQSPEQASRFDPRNPPLEHTPDRRAQPQTRPQSQPQARTLQPRSSHDRHEPVVNPNARPLSPNPAAMPRKKKPVAATSALKDLMFLLMKLAIICFSFVLLFTFLFGVVRYNDSSMDPSIKDGDIVLFFRNKTDKYHPRDVVILDFNGKRQVRRVIATAGDTVDITEDGLYINGALQQEQGIYQKTERYQEGVEFPLVVPEGQVFVMGDSRKDATDSRIYGCVRISDTYGKAMAVIRRRGI